MSCLSHRFLIVNPGILNGCYAQMLLCAVFLSKTQADKFESEFREDYEMKQDLCCGISAQVAGHDKDMAWDE